MTARRRWQAARIALGIAVMAGAAIVGGKAEASCEPGFRFTFYRSSNMNSLLAAMPNSCAMAYASRAGSGVVTDECKVGRGWIPLGTYSLWGHWDHYDGRAIEGRVFWVEDKQCWNGTWRTELFIHTEEAPDQSQSCDGNPFTDEPRCWDGDTDYRSQGCIKVSPAEMDWHHWWYHEYEGERHGRLNRSAFLTVTTMGGAPGASCPDRGIPPVTRPGESVGC